MNLFAELKFIEDTWLKNDEPVLCAWVAVLMLIRRVENLRVKTDDDLKREARQKGREKSRRYREKNKEKIKAYQAEYYRQRNLKEVERRLKALGES
jgi:hypothetical protein